MQSIIHADIFFFISTICLIVISIGIIIALVYFVRILKNVRDISDKFKEESAEVLRDFKDLRSVLREEGIKWKGIADLIRSFFDHKKHESDKKVSKKKVKTSEEKIG